MRITITIPPEFEEHFNYDRFKDSLGRIAYDFREHCGRDGAWLSGNYEKELLDALPAMFANATVVPEDGDR